MRRDYTERGALLEADLAADWTSQFARWFAEASAAGLPEPNAMIVATADTRARPSARTVLLKGYDERGFVFYTNYTSRKGTEALANPAASLVFPWFPMQRQVLVDGAVEKVDRAETEAYFATRPRGSQLGAWASRSRRCCRIARPWSGPSRRRPAGSGRTSRSRRPRTGAGCAWCPRRWSSGRAVPAGCTTACATAGTEPAGRSSDSPPK